MNIRILDNRRLENKHATCNRNKEEEDECKQTGKHCLVWFFFPTTSGLQSQILVAWGETGVRGATSTGAYQNTTALYDQSAQWPRRRNQRNDSVAQFVGKSLNGNDPLSVFGTNNLHKDDSNNHSSPAAAIFVSYITTVVMQLCPAHWPIDPCDRSKLILFSVNWIHQFLSRNNPHLLVERLDFHHICLDQECASQH